MKEILVDNNAIPADHIELTISGQDYFGCGKNTRSIFFQVDDLSYIVK